MTADFELSAIFKSVISLCQHNNQVLLGAEKKLGFVKYLHIERKNVSKQHIR